MLGGQEPGRVQGGCGCESRLGHHLCFSNGALSLLSLPCVYNGARNSYSSGSLWALPEMMPAHRPPQPRHTVGAEATHVPVPRRRATNKEAIPAPPASQVATRCRARPSRPSLSLEDNPLPATPCDSQSGQARSRDLYVPGARALTPSPGASAAGAAVALNHGGCWEVTRERGNSRKKKKSETDYVHAKFSLITQIHLVSTHYNSVGPISQIHCK